MRKRGKVDGNQAEIVDALRKVGASVESLASVGSGVPDLLVGYMGTTHLLEVKADDGKLNDDQWAWHASWKGLKPNVVRSISDAFNAVGVRRIERGK
jgi:hypothetical protein